MGLLDEPVQHAPQDSLVSLGVGVVLCCVWCVCVCVCARASVHARMEVSADDLLDLVRVTS